MHQYGKNSNKLYQVKDNQFEDYMLYSSIVMTFQRVTILRMTTEVKSEVWVVGG